MNGAEHYRLAETLVETAAHHSDSNVADELIRIAQVHAVLAQAAATAALLTVNPAFADYNEARAWADVLND